MGRKWLVAMVIMGLLVVGGGSANQVAAAPSLCEQVQGHSDASLTDACRVAPDALVRLAAMHVEFQVAAKTFGVGAGQAVIVEKEGAPFRLMVIPLKQKDPQELNLLYVYLGTGDDVQRVAVFHTHTDTSGMEISFRTGAGKVISGAVFREGQLVDRLAPSKEIRAAGYWDCWQACMAERWESMPGWVKWACGGSCSACIFSGKLWACPVCAICVGFWGGWCNAECN